MGGRPAFGRDGCLDNDDVSGTQGASLINDDAHTISSPPITTPAPNTSPAPLRMAATFAGATVSVRFLGFTRIWRGSGIAFDKVALFLPDVEYETETAYVRLPPCVRRAVRDAGLEFRAAVHAAAHAVLNVLPLFILCNANDVGTGAEPGYACWGAWRWDKGWPLIGQSLDTPLSLVFCASPLQSPPNHPPDLPSRVRQPLRHALQARAPAHLRQVPWRHRACSRGRSWVEPQDASLDRAKV